MGASRLYVQAGGVVELFQEEVQVKVRASVRRICENCKLIRREGVLRVICTNPKHKQRQG